eukprot:5587295-Prymnesium_polylepis.1
MECTPQGRPRLCPCCVRKDLGLHVHEPCVDHTSAPFVQARHSSHVTPADSVNGRQRCAISLPLVARCIRAPPWSGSQPLTAHMTNARFVHGVHALGLQAAPGRIDILSIEALPFRVAANAVTWLSMPNTAGPRVVVRPFLPLLHGKVRHSCDQRQRNVQTNVYRTRPVGASACSSFAGAAYRQTLASTPNASARVSEKYISPTVKGSQPPSLRQPCVEEAHVLLSERGHPCHWSRDAQCCGFRATQAADSSLQPHRAWYPVGCELSTLPGR